MSQNRGNPWDFTRHLPNSNDVTELRRCLNQVWTTFYQFTNNQTLNLPQNKQGSSGAGGIGGGGTFMYTVPIWVQTLKTPFGVIQLDSSGIATKTAEGYGTIQVVS